MQSSLFGPVPHYIWTAQPGYILHQEAQLQDRGSLPRNETVNASHGKEKRGAPPLEAAGRHGGDYNADCRNSSRSKDTSNNDDDMNNYTVSEESNLIKKSPHVAKSHGVGNHARRHSRRSRTPSTSRQGSLTIAENGEFILGPQWDVPTREGALDFAGYGMERVEVKSLQYSAEHRSHVTLTEQIDSCDVSMSGALPLETPELASSLRNSNCSPFMCIGCPSTPEVPVELPPRPSSKMGWLRSNGLRRLSELFISSPSDRYESELKNECLKRPEHRGSHNNHHDSAFRVETDAIRARPQSTTPRRSIPNERDARPISGMGRDVSRTERAAPSYQRPIRSVGELDSHDESDQELCPRDPRRTRGFYKDRGYFQGCEG
ncbi:hypothetical protein DL766_004163 [Monosporascus sp. MC13-8B]|uniref:Uncharacterized protein n=1 Tax=Monosporascus cannonballus TaxID=155416 RepID=A0ABY0H6X3_9PEZI|nr:hypothetical protein DL763_010227 [Monosporascus cannonballus]RYO83196.1 hypothetical protein DL762_006241 [Monosporascus cannonballus]RYP31976.1 hypothetical protein DL766_004163 [Monosporascus sp. MC13-8B]